MTTSLAADPDARTFDPDLSTDLRRRHRRDLIDRLLERATCLPPADLALLRAAYHDGRTACELASMLGADPRGIRRRIRRLGKRVLSPRFLFVLRNRDQWPRHRQRIATACILHGKSQRQAADELGLTIYTVRRHLADITALFEAQHQ